jgi:hypothetical protein
MRMMEGLATADAELMTVDDRRHLPQSTPHGIEPAGLNEDFGRLIGRTKGGMNTKLHAVADSQGRPLSFFMTAGQVSDYTGAAALLDDLPKAQRLLGDRPSASGVCRASCAGHSP